MTKTSVAATDTRQNSATTRWNFWVDIVTGVVFAAIVGTGILEKWVLPPGSRGGSGLVWLGEGRHFWADIHFWLGISMLALVVVHIWLHWSWVLKVWAKLAGRLTSPVTWLLIILMLVLMLLPLVIPNSYSESFKAEHELLEEESNVGR